MEEYRSSGDILAKLGRFKAAINIFTDLLKENEHDAETHLKRALARCLGGEAAGIYLEDIKR